MHAALMKDERGTALIMVLWFAAALGVIAVDLTVTTRDTALKAANITAGIRARAALEASGNLAFELLQRGAFDSTGEAEWQFGGVDIVARIEPESGKVDLNGATEEMIEGLARMVVEDDDDALDLAHAILDWRDENDLRLSHGAERRDYRVAGLDYSPANGPFRHVRELDAVRGMTRDYYEQLAPSLTIATGASGPDELRASDFVLDALDIALGLATERATERGEGGDRTEQQVTEAEEDDDNFSLSPDEEDEGDAPRPVLSLFDDPAGLYTLDLEARLGSGFTERSRTLVWIGPPFETADFVVLQHESALLPRRTSDGTE